MRARRRVAEVDHLNIARCQERTLRGLVHRAAASPFGQSHDFRRIRTWEDYRRLVPLGSAADMVRANGEAKPRAMLPSNRKSLRSALAFLAVHRPGLRVFDGPIVIVGAEPGLPARRSPLEQVAYRTLTDFLPSKIQPFLGSSPSCLIGTAHGLRAFASALRAVGGRDAKCVAASVCRFIQPGEQRERNADPSVHNLDVLVHPAGILAVEDPRHQRLRFLPDVDLFFEFVPVAEIGRPEPTRHRLAEAVPGVEYELAVASAAGYWSCRTGFRVCFERVDPPVFRTLPAPALAPQAVAPPVPRSLPQPIQRPHARPVPTVPSTLWSVGVF